ncbi:MAG: hypothetical protein H7X99_01995 [Saprospiraceae bacterium]|nr:hypothetical protein [Saprospiraceae bacterium]
MNSDLGLTSSNIKCLLKDHTGYLWIGTDAGLNRFDGKNIVSYNHIMGDSTSLLNDNILSLYEDHLFRIWIGTEGGLSLLIPETGIFENYHSFAWGGKTVSLSSGVRCIGQINDTLWIATDYSLISCSLPSLHFELKMEALKNENKKPIRFLPHQPGISPNGLWFLTSGGIMYVTPEKMVHKANNPENWPILNRVGWISALTNSNDSILYFSTFNFAGIYKYNLSTHHLDSILLTSTDSLQDIQIVSITKNRDEIWGTTLYHGIFRMQLDSGKTFFYRYNRSNAASVSNVAASSIICDGDGTVYMATANGLDYVNPDLTSFRRHTKLTSQFKTMSLVGADDAEGNMWFAPQNQGLFSYSPITENIEVYSLPGKYNSIWTMMYDDGKLMLGTEGGLATFDITHKKFNSLKSKIPQDVADHIGNQSSFIRKDNLGNFWIGLLFNGLIKCNFETHQFIVFSMNEPEHRLMNNHIKTVMLDSEGILWVAYWGNDLTAINTYNNSIHNIKIPEKPNEKIGFVASLKRDNDQNLWISTSQSGLYKYMIHLDSFVSYNTKDGLSSNHLGSITFDHDHNLWINSSNGLNKFNIKKGIITVYTTGDGLPSNQLNQTKNFKNTDGTLFTYSADELVSFNPDELHPNPYLPILILTSYEKSGVKYSIRQSSEPLQLTSSDKLITFQFSAINFIDPDKTEYAYRLDGLDDTWYYTGNQASASFTALPQGDYTLHVKATNKPNHWNVPEKTISFHVDGPLWTKGWFITLCFSIALLLMYGLYRYRLAEFEKLQAIRNRISKDLHDDLGSTLSSISMNSTLAQRIAPPSENGLNPVLQDIGESARSAMDNMSDIVWAINPANETVDNMIERLEKFAQKLLAAQNIKLTLDMNPMLRNIKLTMPQRKNMYLILKESINNIAKYSKASNCYIHGRLENKKIHITIEDDGDGFQTDIVTSGNGIVNMKSRATELNGTLTVNSADLKGTVINLEFAT